VFEASYLVLGLGDVYLGAPVATPLDPRHRLVTTKYNPARTWTPENAVGIGGAYMCVYGMEGPGGYQFVGRTVQMWNRWHHGSPAHRAVRGGQALAAALFRPDPLLPGERGELLQHPPRLPAGRYPLRIEEGHFSLRDYRRFLADKAEASPPSRPASRPPSKPSAKRWKAAGQAEYISEAEVAAAAAGHRAGPARRRPPGRQPRARQRLEGAGRGRPAGEGRRPAGGRRVHEDGIHRHRP
jgi:urea carboxylase